VQPAGHVITVEGAWRLKSDPSITLQPGCRLAPGAEITPPPKFPSGSAKLAIVDRQGGLIVRNCDAGQDCAPPVFLAKDQEARSLVREVLDEIMRKLHAAPAKYVSAIGLGDGHLSDAVLVRTTAGRVDFAPAMQAMAVGDYELELSLLDGGAGFSALAVHWDKASAPADFQQPPGLYGARVKGLAGPEAWVLVASAATADNTRSKERKLLDTMQPWKTEADTENRSARRTVYRAFLASEAEQANAPR